MAAGQRRAAERVARRQTGPSMAADLGRDGAPAAGNEGGSVRSLTAKAEELGGCGGGRGWPLHFKTKNSTDIFFLKQQGRRNGF